MVRRSAAYASSTHELTSDIWWGTIPLIFLGSGFHISTRDVLFNEDTFDGRKTHLNEDRIAQMDELVENISLDPTQAKNEKVLEEGEEILCSEQAVEESQPSSDSGE